MYEHLYIMSMVFTVVFIATMAVLKLKYKTKFNFQKVATISSVVGFAVYLAVIVFILTVIGLPQTGDPSGMIVSTIGELFGWTIGCAIYGVIMYAVARYIIVKPIRSLGKKVKRA